MNNYDPHRPKTSGPWFEGWYTRVTVVNNPNILAVGAVVGSFCGSGKSCKYDQNLPGYAGILVSTPTDLLIFEDFPKSTYVNVDGYPVTSDPDFSSPPNFTWTAPGIGSLSPQGINLTIGGTNLFVNTNGKPQYWNPNKPGEGPEGIAGIVPGLKAHWFVYSVATPSSVVLTQNSVQTVGNGYAHAEKNWGEAFPSGWIWAQGTADNGTSHIAISGGKVPFIVEFDGWLAGYRSQDSGQPGLRWSFNPTNALFLTPQIDGCNGVFTIKAQAFGYSLQIDIRADPSTFKPLAVPTVNGFVKNGCVESYQATISAYALQNGIVVDRKVFQNAALEFGGKFMCNQLVDN